MVGRLNGGFIRADEERVILRGSGLHGRVLHRKVDGEEQKRRERQPKPAARLGAVALAPEGLAHEHEQDGERAEQRGFQEIQQKLFHGDPPFFRLSAAHVVQKLPQLVDLALLERLLGIERGDKAAKRPAVEPLQNAAAFKLEVFVS